MMLLCKLAAAVLVAAVLTLLLKKDQPAFAFLVSVCTAAGLLAIVVRQVQPLLDWLRTLDGYFQGQSPAVLLQVLGIALVAQLAAGRPAALQAAAAHALGTAAQNNHQFQAQLLGDHPEVLHLLLALQAESGFVLSVCHVNHGLRGETADRDEAFVREVCARLGLPLRVFHAAELEAEAGKPRAGEDWARRLR